MFPELPDERQERTGLAKGDAVPFQPGHGFAGLCESTPKLQHQTRFAYARLAGNAYDLSPPGLDLVETIAQRGQFPLSTDERRQPALHRQVKARAATARPQYLEGTHRSTTLH